MDVIEYAPTREQYSYTFGGAAPVMRVKPGTVLRLWSDDAFGGALRNVDDLSSAKVDLRFVNPQTGPFFVEGAELGDTLTVRLDGRRFHSMQGVAFRDRRRDNASELAGRARLVFGYEEVSTDPCGVAGDVAQVLRREGWEGELTSCALCAPPGTQNAHDTDLVLAIDVGHNG